ncbi:MAG: transglycosylase SLT domain-containing protein [Candidatus Woesearchaeota archaeon]
MKTLASIVAILLIGTTSDTHKEQDYNTLPHNKSSSNTQIYSVLTESIDTVIFRPSKIAINTSHSTIAQNETISNTQDLFLKNIYEEYLEHKELIDNWIKINSFPDSLRAVIDMRTIEILDTIPDTREAMRTYKSKWPISVRKYLKSAGGRITTTKKGHESFDKYGNIIREPFDKHNLPRELTYIPLPESNVSVVASKAGAQGYWQIMKGTKGDLIINNRIDERNSIVRSTERAAEKLRGLDALFKDYRFDATCYIRGEYGVATDMEDMLKLNKEGELFKSYSAIIYFHAPNEHKILSRELFWKRIKKLFNNPKRKILNNKLLKENNKYRNDTMPPEELYEQYLHEVKGDDSTYIKSFWEYYGLDLNKKETYWKYHEYLKGTKNNFDSPNYVPRLIAAIVQHNNGFEYNKQQPLKIVEFSPATKEEIKLLSDDPEFIELNRHIRLRDLKNGNVPREARLYKVSE